jgi:predicted dehydrogenase
MFPPMTAPHPRPARVALVGGGDHGLRSVLAAARTLPACELVAVIDPAEAARARAATITPATPTFGSLEAFADAGSLLVKAPPDLIILATPPGATPALLHQILARPTLQTSAILLEKPGAIAASELAAAATSAARHPAPVQVAYNYRQHATVRAFLAASRTAGTPRALQLTFHAPLTAGGWRAGPATGGGALRDLGAHLLDLARRLVPGPLVLDEATFGSLRSEHDTVRLRYRAGPVRIGIDVAYHGAPAFTLALEGGDGRLDCDLWQRTTPTRSRLGALWSQATTRLVPDRRAGARWIAAYARTIRHALSRSASLTMEDGSALPPATLDDAMTVLQLIDEAEVYRA